MKAFINGSIFTGDEFLQDACILINEDQTIRIINTGQLPIDAERIDLQEGYLVPAFIDIQIYGGNGLLFSEYPSIESIKATYDYSLAGGASHILPTIATNSFDKIFEAIEAIKRYWQKKMPGVLGLHVEGPFINPVKKGAHVERYIKRPTMEDIQQLLVKGKGVIKVITLAPEVCSEEMIQYLQKNDVIVSAGHTNATYEEGISCFEKGIIAATHLYNAMSPLQHRAPGMVGAIFNSETVMSSVVADGHHVDFSAIRIAKRLMRDRLFLITDAVTENRVGIYPHHLVDDKYVVADGTLSGSALTMLKAVLNCVTHMDISLEEALRMASLYPAKVVRAGNQLGNIETGYKAELLWLYKSLAIRAVYTNGDLTVF